jgi:hypothetical protein
MQALAVTGGLGALAGLTAAGVHHVGVADVLVLLAAVWVSAMTSLLAQARADYYQGVAAGTAEATAAAVAKLRSQLAVLREEADK